MVTPVTAVPASREVEPGAPPRVLMSADTIGGVWTYALDLAAALGRCGGRVDLATMGRPLSAQQQRDADRVPGLRVHASDFKLEWMDNPWSDVERAGEWLMELEQRLRPDIVHLNGYAHGALTFRAPVVVVAHSCVYSWWRAVRGEEPPDGARYASAVRAGLRSADLVAAPTGAMLDQVRRHYGPLGPCAVVPNGRDPSLYSPGIKEPLILAAGRLWDEAKNIAALGEAGASISWPIYAAGDSAHPSGGDRQLPALKTLGTLSAADLASWLARASIYALPARYEPFGLSVLEAALSGCALVLGDIPSLREVWADAALYVSPDDRSALRDALRRLIDDSQFRQMMAGRAMERARIYTLEAMAAGYLDLYGALLPGRRQSRRSDR